MRKLDGSFLKNETEILSKWRDYFSKLLNNKNANASTHKSPASAPSHPGINTAPIKRAEVNSAIKSHKRGKAPGPDYAMTVEVLKDALSNDSRLNFSDSNLFIRSFIRGSTFLGSSIH
jgi:hypothetical protein